MKDEKIYIKKLDINLNHKDTNENNMENENNEKNKNYKKFNKNYVKIDEKRVNFCKIQKIFYKKPNFNEKIRTKNEKLNGNIKNEISNENDYLVLSQKAKFKFVLNWLIKLVKTEQLSFKDVIEIIDKIAKNE